MKPRSYGCLSQTAFELKMQAIREARAAKLKQTKAISLSVVKSSVETKVTKTDAEPAQAIQPIAAVTPVALAAHDLLFNHIVEQCESSLHGAFHCWPKDLLGAIESESTPLESRLFHMMAGNYTAEFAATVLNMLRPRLSELGINFSVSQHPWEGAPLRFFKADERGHP